MSTPLALAFRALGLAAMLAGNAGAAEPSFEGFKRAIEAHYQDKPMREICGHRETTGLRASEREYRTLACQPDEREAFEALQQHGMIEGLTHPDPARPGLGGCVLSFGLTPQGQEAARHSLRLGKHSACFATHYGASVTHILRSYPASGSNTGHMVVFQVVPERVSAWYPLTAGAPVPDTGSRRVIPTPEGFAVAAD